MLIRWLSASSVNNANVCLLAVRLMQFIIKLFLYHCRCIFIVQPHFLFGNVPQSYQIRLHSGNDSSIIAAPKTKDLFTTFVFNQLETNSFILRNSDEKKIVDTIFSLHFRSVKVKLKIEKADQFSLTGVRPHELLCIVLYHRNEYWLHNFWMHFEMGSSVFQTFTNSTFNLIWWNGNKFESDMKFNQIDLTCVIPWIYCRQVIKL